MNTRLNAFNRVAGFYDLFKGVVFGRAIYQSKTHYIRSADIGPNILIIGGGSGETLPLILERHPGAQIWFLDASSEMLRRARLRTMDISHDNIRFVHATTEAWVPESVVFDTVITDFFFDLFSDESVARMARSISGQLKPGGLWLAADFVDTGKTWQKIMLWSMYRFFRMACGIEARRLPTWPSRIASAGMELISSSAFYGGFIRSTVYRRRSP